jgi:hypothetical protein
VTKLFRKEIDRQHWPWLLLFPIMLLIMISKARNGELLLQHRFSATLILLFIPYLTLASNMIRSGWTLAALAISICSVSIAGAATKANYWPASLQRGLWNEAFAEIRSGTMDQLHSIPTLRSDLPDRLIEEILVLSKEKRLLVLDHFGWEETYNVALRSNIIATSIVFLPSDVEGDPGLKKLDHYLDHISGFDGILMIRAQGPYNRSIRKDRDGRATIIMERHMLQLHPISNVEEIALYHFDVIGLPMGPSPSEVVRSLHQQ